MTHSIRNILLIALGFISSLVGFSQEPTIQASNILLTNPTANSMNVDYSAGNGSSRILVMKSGSSVDAFPVDGMLYNGSGMFGGGDQIGTGNFVVAGNIISGLSSGVTYHFRAFKYNQVGNSTNYNINTALGNPASRSTSVVEPTIATSNLTVGLRTSTSIQLSWTNGKGAPLVQAGVEKYHYSSIANVISLL